MTTSLQMPWKQTEFESQSQQSHLSDIREADSKQMIEIDVENKEIDLQAEDPMFKGIITPENHQQIERGGYEIDR